MLSHAQPAATVQPLTNAQAEQVLEARIATYPTLANADPNERERLRRDVVRFYTPYVERIARGLARREYDPVEDLIQVGCLGLVKALEKYDPALNVRYKTYCTYHVTGEIRHYLRDKASMIKPPRAIYELYYRMNQVINELSQRLGRQPTDLELAQALQCPAQQVAQAHDVERRQTVLPLDVFALENGEGNHYLERLVDERTETALAQLEDKLMVEAAFVQLSEAHQQVLTLYYYEEMSQPKIAHRLGISQMQVSRRLRQALSQLEQELTQPTKQLRRKQGHAAQRQRLGVKAKG
jgi:RNA polymerase sigma-B factor